MGIKTAVVSVLILMVLAGCASESSQITGSAVQDTLGQGKKIAVASDGDNENSRISPGIGKASYFLIFEGETLVNTIENTYGTGACTEVAQLFLEEHVDIVVCGKFGLNIIGFLKQNGIVMYTAKGRLVRDAVGDITKGVSADEASPPKGSKSKQGLKQ